MRPWIGFGGNPTNLAEDTENEAVAPNDITTEATEVKTGRCSIQPRTMKNMRLACFITMGIGCVLLLTLVDVMGGVRDFLLWMKEHTLLGVLLLSLSIIGGSVVMLPVMPLMMGAGFSLGVVPGQIAVSLGCTIGAQLAFVVARTLLRDWVEEMVLPRVPQLSSLNGVIAQKSTSLKVCLLIRMCPVLPFAMLNYSLGVTALSWRSHLIGTWIGMFPEQLMLVFLGSTLRDVNEIFQGEVTMIKHPGSSVDTCVSIIVLIVFTIVGTIFSQSKLRDIALQYEASKTSAMDPMDVLPGEESEDIALIRGVE